MSCLHETSNSNVLLKQFWQTQTCSEGANSLHFCGQLFFVFLFFFYIKKTYDSRGTRRNDLEVKTNISFNGRQLPSQGAIHGIFHTLSYLPLPWLGGDKNLWLLPCRIYNELENRLLIRKLRHKAECDGWRVSGTRNQLGSEANMTLNISCYNMINCSKFLYGEISSRKAGILSAPCTIVSQYFF